MYSICQTNLAGPLSAIASGIVNGDSASTGTETTDVATTNVTTGDTTAATDEPETTADTADATTGGLAPAAGVDILFVMDNSGSMAPSQQRIADAIDAFVDPLTAAGLDLRIAVTTTDTGNPRCPSTTPEDGAFVASSCRARVPLGEFTTQDIDQSAACLDACAHDAIDVLPTTTDSDPNPAARPWIEWSPGATNVEVPLVEALACVLPQGVAGCGFESPLAAMATSIARMADANDPAAGFLRPDAHFVVIIVTDETDCSYNPEFSEIFIDNEVFWNDPVQDPAPSSAMCWHAGVACEGGPDSFTGCAAVDRESTHGDVTEDPTQAVLVPVATYTDLLAQIQTDKQIAGSAAQVQMVVIGGVPGGYPQNPLEFTAHDQEWVELFGIDPGCDNMGITAVPPMRMLEVTQAHSPLGQGLYSLCQTTLDAPLAAIAAGILGQ
jgi:hypothetical protein